MEDTEKEKNYKKWKEQFGHFADAWEEQWEEEEKAKKEQNGQEEKRKTEKEEEEEQKQAEKELDQAYKLKDEDEKEKVGEERAQEGGKQEKSEEDLVEGRDRWGFIRISDFFSPEDIKRIKSGKSLIDAMASKMIKDRENKLVFISDGLQEREVEIDPEGKLILYHATIAEHYFLIEKDSAIKPSILTGKIGWRHPSEKEPKKEVYLATREDAENFATILQRMYGGSAYILEVHLAEKDILIDKDVQGNSWRESMRRLGCCSIAKSIGDYKVAGKLDFRLSEKREDHYKIKLEEAEKGSEEEARIKKEREDEIAKGIAAEEEQARKILDEKKEEE